MGLFKSKEQKLKEKAEKEQLLSVVFTFDKIPLSICLKTVSIAVKAYRMWILVLK